MPKPVLHVILATPTLSDAVPVIAIDGADVETVVLPGETIVSVGGVVSVELPPLPPVDVWRVMLNDFVATAALVEAVTVMILLPMLKRMVAFHAEAGPVAIPVAAPFSQETVVVPEPPVAEPVKVMEAAVVARGVVLIVKRRGAEPGTGAGAGVGAGVLVLAAA
jgi:hypothetical protein